MKGRIRFIALIFLLTLLLVLLSCSSKPNYSGNYLMDSVELEGTLYSVYELYPCGFRLDLDEGGRGYSMYGNGNSQFYWESFDEGGIISLSRIDFEEVYDSIHGDPSNNNEDRDFYRNDQSYFSLDGESLTIKDDGGIFFGSQYNPKLNFRKVDKDSASLWPNGGLSSLKAYGVDDECDICLEVSVQLINVVADAYEKSDKKNFDTFQPFEEAYDGLWETIQRNTDIIKSKYEGGGKEGLRRIVNIGKTTTPAVLLVKEIEAQKLITPHGKGANAADFFERLGELINQAKTEIETIEYYE